MASKRRISYQWQLFIPLVATLWIIIAGMTFWQFYNEREYRKAQISEQLSLVASRIVAANERDFDATPFMDFATNYYRENPLYDLLRITVYKDGRMIRCYGEPIALTDSEQALEQGVTNVPGAKPEPASSPDAGKYFYYSVKKSDDGRVTVYTVLPFDNDILNASLPSTRIFWVMFVIALIVTILAYYSTRYFGRNISNLRTVAERASTDPNFIPAMDYPHDELGDISRQIISMYNQRSQAMQRQKKEHAVALHAIEEKAKSKRQLTNNINHELKTPVAAMQACLETLMTHRDLPPEKRDEFIARCHANGERLKNLLADVSLITRMDDGGTAIARTRIDLREIIAEACEDFALPAAGRGVELLNGVSEPLPLTGNAALLASVFRNLIDNALAYSGCRRIEIRLLASDDDTVALSVADDGCGVAEEHLPHLFERFYRVDKGRSRQAGGTGLGLSIVKNAVLWHGGDITAENRHGGGLQFRFTLKR